jgi:Fe-S-cluster-containing hydrogenase component 2
MIVHYGYTDGSGEYYITIDTDKCTGCGKCIQACPQDALQFETVMVDLDDKTVASIKEDCRRKIKYICTACKPENAATPCMSACDTQAIKCTWKA